MMKLKLKQGEYVNIGEEVRVVFTGGSMNKVTLLIEAPREMHIERSANDTTPGRKEYYKDTPISTDAQNAIRRILKEERERAKWEAQQRNEKC